MNVKDLLKEAYLEGFRKGVEAHAWWDGGRQFVGNGTSDLREALRESSEEAEPLFEAWLERQRTRFNQGDGS